MNDKLFEVKIYYSGFSTYKVNAKSEDEAINQARKLTIKKNEIFKNIECWHEADEAIELKNENRKN